MFKKRGCGFIEEQDVILSESPEISNPEQLFAPEMFDLSFRIPEAWLQSQTTPSPSVLNSYPQVHRNNNCLTP